MFSDERISQQISRSQNLLTLDTWKKTLPQIENALVPFVNKGSQLFWPCLFAFFFLALLSYLYYRPKGEKLSLRRAINYVLPAKSYFHRSALVDYLVFSLNIILFAIPKFALISIVSVCVSVYTGGIIHEAFGQSQIARISWSPFLSFTLFFLSRELIGDFIYYWYHRFFHKNSVLWPLHRLHHSAEVLNPFTLNRKHPLYNIIVGGANSIVMGVFTAILFSLFVGKPTVYSMFGVSLLRGAYNATGAALRHTNIWISYGPILSRILISPAQHQIHHSTDPKHIDKNFGEIFALWDWMFGTLYVPKKKEVLEFGLGKDAKRIHGNVVSAYVEPVFASAKAILDLVPKLPASKPKEVYKIRQNKPIRSKN